MKTSQVLWALWPMSALLPLFLGFPEPDILFLAVYLGLLLYYIPIKLSAGRLALLDCLTFLVVLFHMPVCTLRARPQGQLTACKSNMKNIATSLEMYSTDHEGHYPQALSQLTPNYLKAIPHCPCAQKDTYSSAYHRTQKPDAYTIGCEGCWHHEAGIQVPNYPLYDSYEGLVMP